MGFLGQQSSLPTSVVISIYWSATIRIGTARARSTAARSIWYGLYSTGPGYSSSCLAKVLVCYQPGFPISYRHTWETIIWFDSVIGNWMGNKGNTTHDLARSSPTYGFRFPICFRLVSVRLERMHSNTKPDHPYVTGWYSHWIRLEKAEGTALLCPEDRRGILIRLGRWWVWQ